MNNSQEIILAQISAIYDKPPFVKVKTGQMEMILKCVGLGKYYDEYAKYLEPYWYNRGFQNDIESYRIFVGLNSIFEDLLNIKERSDGTPIIMECNPRITAGIPVFYYAGVNLPYLCVKKILGEELPKSNTEYGLVVKRRWQEMV